MNENLNLVEILKDCPKGIELYSPMYGLGILTKVTNRIHVKFPKEHNVKCFRPDGKVSEDGEIMLFPKGKTTWEGFQRPFVDGDIITYMFWRKPTTYIYRENGTHNTSYYVAYSSENNKLYDDGKGALAGNRHGLRFATEDEKKKLFDVIREKGYKWNPETKTLEKLIVPKFKVGDKIIHKLTGNVHKVLCVLSNGYNGGVYDVAITNEIGKSIDIKEQDNYELVPNKFDPKTLKSFDKVLVRDFSNQKWTACLFSHIDNDAYHQFKTSTALGWYHCIPFNEDTKHLVGKMDEAPEFYRYWDEQKLLLFKKEADNEYICLDCNYCDCNNNYCWTIFNISL